MAKKDLPPVEVLRQLLRYDPETGKLFWRERGPEWFRDNSRGTAMSVCLSWNKRLSGREALAAKGAWGYPHGDILGIPTPAHIVAFAMGNGHLPVGDVDHINGVRDDNRIANLRDATRSQNLQNRGKPKNNKTGVKGVCWSVEKGKYKAEICSKRKRTSLGYFSSLQDASDAYDRAAAAIHGDYAHANNWQD